ncbi:MAG: transcriptional repressor [Firmicutes bacterium]|nr:transcriptional repressor [Bacillota bacterium]
MADREKNEGSRTTRQRQAILEAFTDDQVHLSAEEVFLLVRASQPAISLGTVYRNLDLLTRQGALQQFVMADGTRKYERASEHHHHLVCIGCGQAENIPECPLDQRIRGYTRESRFQVVRHSFEVYGYCVGCQGQVTTTGSGGKKH